MHRRTATLAFASLLHAVACTAAPLGFKPGAGSTLALHPIALDLPADALSPLQSNALLRQDGTPPTYFIATGLGAPQIGVGELPGAAAWRVEPDSVCARLVPMPLATLKALDAQPVPRDDPLPATCASRLAGDCTSADGLLRIETAFDGTRRMQPPPTGTGRRFNPNYYTGTRTLTITHQPSGRRLRLRESLKDTQAYSTPQTAIRYLPELRRILLLGVVVERQTRRAHCVQLPPG